MTQKIGDLHVYLREIKDGERTSLSVLADLIPHGATVLDLGTGSGALGQYLGETRGCTVDGVTFNEEEAAYAKPFYRSLHVADLDTCTLEDIFARGTYDAIVCADVLEHLRLPSRILDAARQLLSPDGQVLISIPNAAYCGLVGELMLGEFRYRNEGLLDGTHLRFFTRRSLARFLHEAGWTLHGIDEIRRELVSSEFRLAFDRLPPTVSRYLLSRPDALTYQFIAQARPGVSDHAVLPPGPEDGRATFTAELYLGRDGGYREDAKLLAVGTIGQGRQRLRFDLPRGQGWTQLRLDPADRPGFLHLHTLTLHGEQGNLLWRWHGTPEGLTALLGSSRQQMVMASSAFLPDGAMVLLHGDDPWIELPIPAAIVSAATVLEVELGWPMSADYIALSGSVQQAEDARTRTAVRLAETETALQRERGELNGALVRERGEHAEQLAHEQRSLAERLAQDHRHQSEQLASVHAEQLAQERARLSEQLALERQRLTALVEEERAQLLDEQRKHEQIARTLETVREQRYSLSEQNRLLQEQRRGLSTELHLLRSDHRRLETEFTQLATHLRWIEESTVFRATRPLVHAKMRIDQLFAPPAPALPESVGPAAPPAPTRALAVQTTVDVIVPVYRGLEDTRRCIESVLLHACESPFRLIVINDCSPEPAVTEWLRQVADSDPRLMLLENEENLGFVGTVNRGMALSKTHDVLLLNSDAEVANDWLDRIHRAAYSDERVATVTPFSNNATICSYPRFCEDNALPAGYDTASLDRLFAATNAGQVVDVPTGIGFCMYIRRACLDEVGLFDVESFGKGYGEENDFCLRAAAAGWRNLHALDTFVMHAGGVSFGAGKSPREQAAMETLRRLHPHYEPEVHRFIGRDPARMARLAVDLARVRDAGLPVVLAIMHDRHGGTLRHVGELAEHMRGTASFFMLTPTPGGVTLRLVGAGEAFVLMFRLPDEFEGLLQALRSIGVQHLHYHHMLGHGQQIVELPQHLGLPYDFTAHDFYTVCPQISLTDKRNAYCGELGVDQCRACLESIPAPGNVDIETWRARFAPLLSKARHVLVPSRDAGRRLARYIPQADIHLAPHTDIVAHGETHAPAPQLLGPNARLKIAVLGALSPIKGADVLEDVATEALKRNSPLEFHLFGYGYRSLRTRPKSALTVHGKYEEDELQGLLDWLKPDLVWFPAQWPETYSYTLSACLEAGLPVVGPDLGAFAERLSGRPWSWVRPWATTPTEWVAFFERIRDQNFTTGRSPSPQWFALMETGADALIRDWNYDRDYLAGVGAAPAAAVLTPAFLTAYQPDREGLPGHANRVARQRTLDMLVQLRRLPVLRGLARAVPLRWQTRVKSWLRT